MTITRSLLPLLILAACKSGGDSKTADDQVASCDMPEVKQCREYRGGNLALGTDSLKKLCTGMPGMVFATTPCPSANLAATCAKSEGTDLYYAGSELLETAERYCKQAGGAFTRAK